MRLELGEKLEALAKLALSANNNLSDNAFAGDLKQRRRCYLFDVCLVRLRQHRRALAESRDET
jgi:hypothetical protein